MCLQVSQVKHVWFACTPALLLRRTELISERNNELHRVAAALEDAKQQLENRGSNLTDASPLVRLKAAMSSLREELKGMELRIGVVAHNLMSLSLHDKQSALQDAAKRRVKDVTTAKHPVP
jgi:estrogen-related receptor beta like 1